jgi:hypothetical protein
MKRADGGARLAHAGLLWSVASLVGWPNKVLVVVLLIELANSVSRVTWLRAKFLLRYQLRCGPGFVPR